MFSASLPLKTASHLWEDHILRKPESFSKAAVLRLAVRLTPENPLRKQLNVPT